MGQGVGKGVWRFKERARREHAKDGLDAPPPPPVAPRTICMPARSLGRSHRARWPRAPCLPAGRGVAEWLSVCDARAGAERTQVGATSGNPSGVAWPLPHPKLLFTGVLHPAREIQQLWSDGKECMGIGAGVELRGWVGRGQEGAHAVLHRGDQDASRQLTPHSSSPTLPRKGFHNYLVRVPGDAMQGGAQVQGGEQRYAPPPARHGRRCDSRPFHILCVKGGNVSRGRGSSLHADCQRVTSILRPRSMGGGKALEDGKRPVPDRERYYGWACHRLPPHGMTPSPIYCISWQPLCQKTATRLGALASITTYSPFSRPAPAVSSRHP